MASTCSQSSRSRRNPIAPALLPSSCLALGPCALGVDALFGELPGVRLHCGRCCLSRKVEAFDDEGNGSCRDFGGGGSIHFCWLSSDHRRFLPQ